MNKTALKIFTCFTVISALISTILLVINFLGFAFIGSDTHINLHGNSPKGMLDKVSDALVQTDNGFELTDENVISSDCWCILIDKDGNIIWSKNKPYDIPQHYSINDIARMTRWFLNDYPVYVHTKDYGLLVLGIPKNAVGKYDMAYSMEWFDTLPQRLTVISILNLILAAALAFVIGIFLYKRIYVLSNGISDLQEEKSVKLKESGIFKELARNINDTSRAIERKNTVLAAKDNARLNWISGISHDIRTPLSIVIGNSEALENDKMLSDTNRQKAKTITAQSIKIKKLIEDLNFISSLEYDMQPAKRNNVRICPLIRQIITDIMNSGLSDKFEIELNLQDEKAAVSADESLLERAIFNLINNSITHNKSGCKIHILEYTKNGTVHLDISDNGKGVQNEVIENITKMPKFAHGLGLPMAYRIIYVHGGKLKAFNDNGFTVKIEFPKMS